MGDPQGFLKVKRKGFSCRPVDERVKDFQELFILPVEERSREQASRCMDCGTPFCHWGCPIANYIPEWNDLMFRGRWERAIELLNATNNLPEITGRVCPAYCEYACVLGINDDAVIIRENELALIEYAFKAGLIKPRPPRKRSGEKVAVIGSGPAGLSCANELNKMGHRVTVFERNDKIGGLLRYGIPDFKLEKWVLERRLKILKKEGIEFITGVNAGVDYPISKLKKEFDAVCLTTGCCVPRDLKIKGRELAGIHFAMDFLTQANRRAAREKIPSHKLIDARGKRVVVIGGGDTGADCMGVAHRQGATCVIQIELLPQPSECRPKDMPWPNYPTILKSSTSHEEGGERKWSVLTKKFIGENGRVKKLSCVRVKFVSQREGKTCPTMEEVAASEFEIEADLVILAMGFVHPEREGLLERLGVQLTKRRTVQTDASYATSLKGVFAAGDIRRGASLVVWAIYEGRSAAQAIDRYLKRK